MSASGPARVEVDPALHLPPAGAPSTCMDDVEIGIQRLAQVARITRQPNFRLLQLRHTNEQLEVVVQDPAGRASLIRRL